jgi:hypothetical protein
VLVKGIGGDRDFQPFAATSDDGERRHPGVGQNLPNASTAPRPTAVVSRAWQTSMEEPAVHTGMWRCASVLLATASDFRAAIAQWSSHAQGNATIGTKMIPIA